MNQTPDLYSYNVTNNNTVRIKIETYLTGQSDCKYFLEIDKPNEYLIENI